MSEVRGIQAPLSSNSTSQADLLRVGKFTVPTKIIEVPTEIMTVGDNQPFRVMLHRFTPRELTSDVIAITGGVDDSKKFEQLIDEGTQIVWFAARDPMTGERMFPNHDDLEVLKGLPNPAIQFIVAAIQDFCMLGPRGVEEEKNG